MVFIPVVPILVFFSVILNLFILKIIVGVTGVTVVAIFVIVLFNVVGVIIL